MNSLPDPPVNAPKASVGGLASGQIAGAGRFLLQKVLGQGGMGVVWLAQDRLLREPVALKFLPPQITFDPAALQGLRREALRARKLSHPNIVRIHDLIDVPDEPPFICMEYVDGPTLHSLRANRAGQILTWQFLAPLVKQLCAALDYAHGEKIIHRDIKPANLMLGNVGRLKLADFGLAHVVSDSLSRLSEQPHTSGTLGYMSPQQADGQRPHVSDDVYALGATLYELLTSTPPFYSGDISYQVRNRAPDAMSQRLTELDLRNEIPPHISALVMACLAKEAELRPRSAKAVLEWLDSAERIEPGPVREPEPANTPAESAPSRFRTKTAWIVAGLLLTAVFASMAWYLATTTPSEKAERISESASLPAAANRASGAASMGQPASLVFEEDFEVLFNGRDLTGWDGDTNYWHVRDGAITAFTAEEEIKRRENTCLIWHGTVDDFELRLKFRMDDVIIAKAANSGVLYRGRRLDGWQVRGYQFDLHGDFAGTFLLLWNITNDPPRVDLGHSALLREAKGKTVIKSKGALSSPAQIKSSLQRKGWNELVLIAQGNHLIHQINGVVTADVLDESVSAQAFSGCLALELKRATTVQFKDIRLKRLPQTASGQR